ncbi:membrane protein [Klebsiella sp. RIT-PI-d]|uniref:inner membrane protein YbjM n=1 Tax=Klebsiella sp. RIT-PI-d TaxID=1681196 RepID=UPI000675BEA2|nr:inner membrane protein YbjM [Klebsiella sp. RIT-PI-d]KNC08876.1 membrane protein [Klebsiella sp. RIT-PI-d]
MKSERGWAGVVCCFLLFIIVYLGLSMKMQGAFRTSGNPELGLLFFILPGAVASFLSSRRRVLRPLLGAILAAPLCLVVMRLFFTSYRSVWQELAWLFSAVFWCALGALCFLFISSLLEGKRR